MDKAKIAEKILGLENKTKSRDAWDFSPESNGQLCGQ